MKLVKNKVERQLRDQVFRQVSDQVREQVTYQVKWLIEDQGAQAWLWLALESSLESSRGAI